MTTGAVIGSDLRVFLMRNLYSMGVADTIPMIYPRMFQLHEMEDPIGSLNELNQVVLPPRIRMSGERMDSMGAYLIENGQQLILWLGKSVPPELLQDLLGVNDLTEIDLNTVRSFFLVSSMRDRI
jgi:protein transport protein SEC24